MKFYLKQRTEYINNDFTLLEVGNKTLNREIADQLFISKDKAKTIPKNRILCKPKYDFKKKIWK